MLGKFSGYSRLLASN